MSHPSPKQARREAKGWSGGEDEIVRLKASAKVRARLAEYSCKGEVR